MKTFIIIFISMLCNICIYAQELDFNTVLSKAQKGDADNQVKVGKFYYTGKGVSIDYTQAVYWFRKAAEQGNATGQANLGVCYGEGKGVSQDYTQAVYWFKKAAEQGNATGQEHLGYFYDNGLGVAQDYQQAVFWCKKAAEQGKENAQLILASCYYNGLGVAQDYQQAVYWFRKAAEQGNKVGQFNLGVCYKDGHGVSKDETQAVYWFRKAAEQGHVTAQYILGCCYHLGFYGVSKDYKQAVYWYTKAAEQGDKSAQENLLVLQEQWNAHPDSSSDIAEKNESSEQAKNDILSMIDKEIPTTAQKSNNTFAFIIANEAYKRVEPVPFAKNDGKIFAEYCQKTLGVPEKNMHLQTDATLGDIKYQVSQMKQIANAFDGDAKFIFYYAGHGLPAEDQQDAFLLPVDGYGTDGTGYSVNELYNELGALNATSVVVLLDACFSGAKRDGGMITSARSVALKAKQAAPKGNMVVFSATQGDETAFPYKEKGHGLFTYYLLKKLNESKGNVTLGELADYITSGVKKTSIVENGKLQTPSVNASPSLSNTWRSMNLK